MHSSKSASNHRANRAAEPCDTRAGPLLLYGGGLQVPAWRNELKYRYRLVRSGIFGTGKATDEWLIKSGST